jgi:hypothetical protein
MTDFREEKKDDFEFKGTYQKKYENIKNLLQSALNQIEKVQNAIENLEQEDRRTHYQNIPGTEGVFDGQYLVAQDGRKTEVPANYAAKSKLVYGDILKVFTDSGRQIFKQIDRVERKKIEGVLAKKEGKWYLLADSGSYKISDASAEYNKAELNDRASALIPAENPKVSFASLDVVFKENDAFKPKEKIFEKPSRSEKYEKTAATSKKRPSGTSDTVVKKSLPSSFSKKGGDYKPRPKATPVETTEKELKKEKTAEVPNKEYVNNIMDDDDLR